MASRMEFDAVRTNMVDFGTLSYMVAEEDVEICKDGSIRLFGKIVVYDGNHRSLIFEVVSDKPGQYPILYKALVDGTITLSLKLVVVPRKELMYHLRYQFGIHNGFQVSVDPSLVQSNRYLLHMEEMRDDPSCIELFSVAEIKSTMITHVLRLLYERKGPWQHKIDLSGNSNASTTTGYKKHKKATDVAPHVRLVYNELQKHGHISERPPKDVGEIVERAELVWRCINEWLQALMAIPDCREMFEKRSRYLLTKEGMKPLVRLVVGFIRWASSDPVRPASVRDAIKGKDIDCAIGILARNLLANKPVNQNLITSKTFWVQKGTYSNRKDWNGGTKDASSVAYELWKDMMPVTGGQTMKSSVHSGYWTELIPLPNAVKKAQGKK